MPVLDFPASPLTGDKYPVPAVAGQPQYTYDGVKWTTIGAQISNAAPATATPLMDVTPAVVGTATKYAREDHQHPTDTSLLAKSANLADVADVTASRKSIYAAPFDALAYNGMQINGSMEVSQENGGTLQPINRYPADGWAYSAGAINGTTNVQQTLQSPGGGLKNTIVVTVATAPTSIAAGDWYMFYQRIEGNRTVCLGWGFASAQPITIGFWTGHHRTGLYGVAVGNSDATRSYVATYTQAAADTWQYNVVTIPGCSDGTWLYDNGSGIMLKFAVAAGTTYTASSANVWLNGSYMAAPGQVNGVGTTSDIFRLTGVVVLPGIEAPSAARSPLIMRPFDQELLTCKRYYQMSDIAIEFPATGAGQFGSTPVAFSPELRASPSLLTSVPLLTANGTFQFATTVTHARGAAAQFQSAAAGRAYYYGTAVADARL